MAGKMAAFTCVALVATACSVESSWAEESVVTAIDLYRELKAVVGSRQEALYSRSGTFRLDRFVCDFSEAHRSSRGFCEGAVLLRVAPSQVTTGRLLVELVDGSVRLASVRVVGLPREFFVPSLATQFGQPCEKEERRAEWNEAGEKVGQITMRHWRPMPGEPIVAVARSTTGTEMLAAMDGATVSIGERNEMGRQCNDFTANVARP